MGIYKDKSHKVLKPLVLDVLLVLEFLTEGAFWGGLLMVCMIFLGIYDFPIHIFAMFLTGTVISLILWITELRFLRAHLFLLSNLKKIIQDKEVRVIENPRMSEFIKISLNKLLLVAFIEKTMFYISAHAVSTSNESTNRFIKKFSKNKFLLQKVEKENKGITWMALNWFNLFILGDFSSLPQSEIYILKDTPLESTGNSKLDEALKDAQRVLVDPDMFLEIEASGQFIRVGLWGGPWLGRILEERVTQMIDFTEKLAEGLAPHYSLNNPTEWTVEHKKNEFIISKVEPKEYSEREN